MGTIPLVIVIAVISSIITAMILSTKRKPKSNKSGGGVLSAGNEDVSKEKEGAHKLKRKD